MASALALLELIQLASYKDQFGSEFPKLFPALEKHIRSADYQSELLRRSNNVINDVLEGVTGLPQDSQYKNIEDLRAAAAKAHREAIQELNSSIDQLKKTGRYSQYENPSAMRLIEQIRRCVEPGVLFAVDRIRKSPMADRADFPADLEEQLSRVKFGSLPFSSFNAFAIGGDNYSDHAIVFHAGLLRFVARVSRIVNKLMYAVPVDQHDRIDWHSTSWPKEYESLVVQTLATPVGQRLCQQYIATVDAYFLYDGPYDFDAQFFYNDISWTSSTHMAFGAEVFIMGHEYAHIINQDFKKLKTAREKVQGVEIQKYNPNHGMEHAADLLGATFASNAIGMELERSGVPEDYQTYLKQFYLLGIPLTFACARAVDQYASFFKEKDTVYDTHPNPNSRNRITNGLLADLVGGDIDQFIEKLARTIAPIERAASTHFRNRLAGRDE